MNDASFPFKSILVVGLGLIGGSILKDLKKLKVLNKVFGVDLDKKIVSKAFELNLIRNKDNNLDKMGEDTLVIFSVPSLSFEAAYNSLHNLLPDEKVTLTDTMSSKGNLIDFLRILGGVPVFNRLISNPIFFLIFSAILADLPVLSLR